MPKIRFPFLYCLFGSCLTVCSLASVNAQESLPAKPAAEPGHETVLVTKAMTGEYNPRFQPKFADVISGIVDQTNAFRKAEKLNELTRSEILEKTAQEFASYMAKTGKYGHSADDRTPSERATAQHYEICYIGENIAMQYKSDGFATGPLTKLFFQGWKNSPPHRANMLNAAVTETGVGIAQSTETGAYFAVQLVGRPLSQAIDFQVHNETNLELTYQVGDEKFSLPPEFTRRHQLCAPAAIKVIVDEKEVATTQLERAFLYAVQSTSGGIRIEKTPQPVPNTKP